MIPLWACFATHWSTAEIQRFFWYFKIFSTLKSILKLFVWLKKCLKSFKKSAKKGVREKKNPQCVWNSMFCACFTDHYLLMLLAVTIKVVIILQRHENVWLFLFFLHEIQAEVLLCWHVYCLPCTISTHFISPFPLAVKFLSSCISSFFHYLTQEPSVSLYAGFTRLDFVPIVE